MVVVSVLHVILALWPPVLNPAARFAFVSVLFVLFLLFVVVFGEPKQN